MSKGYLTTHVLDTFNGTPGSGIKASLYKIDTDKKTKIIDFKLNEDGRSNGPVLESENFIKGKYELVFFCGDYFKSFTNLDEPYFLDDVVIRFGINNINVHYHVPLLISPWSYTTYRGS
jgi:5-hydroxyisourate hydrolase|tara:strand:- start:199 stop:555 length:357 start_codon:yes stop_codon:yes gene_type:complete